MMVNYTQLSENVRACGIHNCNEKANIIICWATRVGLMIGLLACSITHNLFAAGVPQCHWYGEFDEFNCIVLDLLGPSLKDVRQCMTPMPFDIVIELIYQMVKMTLL